METITAALIQNMADSTAMELVPPEFVAEMKARGDKRPLFNVYNIAHTGISRGKEIVPGIGKVDRALRWISRTVHRVKELIKVNTPAFIHHNKDNSYQGRTQIGHVVNTVMEGDSAKVVIYVYPEYRGNKYKINAASFEGVVAMEKSTGVNGSEIRTVLPGDVKAITAIALGDSRTNTPAFENAFVENCLQMFSDSEKVEKKKTRELGKMTKEEIKAAIKAGGILPEDLFSSEELGGTEAFTEKDKLSRKALDNQNNANMRLLKSIEAKDAAIEQKDIELKKMQAEINKLGSQAIFDQVIAARPALGEKAKSLIALRKAEYDTGLPDSKDGFLNYYAQKIDADLMAYKDIIGDSAPGQQSQISGQGQATGSGAIPDALSNANMNAALKAAGFDPAMTDTSLLPGMEPSAAAPAAGAAGAAGEAGAAAAAGAA